MTAQTDTLNVPHLVFKPEMMGQPKDVCPAYLANDLVPKQYESHVRLTKYRVLAFVQ